MRHPLIVAAALAALSLNAQAAPRVLLESPDAEVRMEQDLRCGRDAEVTVVARDPELLSGGSPRMQSLLDATRAVLGFECRNIAGIVVVGRLAGLDEAAYQAVAGPETDWRLDASRTVQVSALGNTGWTPPTASTSQGSGYKEWSPPGSSAAGGNDYAVRDLHRGMGVDEALAAARQSFSSDPQYDRASKLLTVVDGGCPVAGEALRREFWPRAGDTCLEAAFGDDGRGQLQRLLFGQVVDTDQSAAIRTALEQRYGKPAMSTQPSPGTTRLAWGRPLPGERDRYELEAEIGVREDTTVLVIQLAGGNAQQPRYQADF